MNMKKGLFIFCLGCLIAATLPVVEVRSSPRAGQPPTKFLRSFVNPLSRRLPSGKHSKKAPSPGKKVVVASMKKRFKCLVLRWGLLLFVWVGFLEKVTFAKANKTALNVQFASYVFLGLYLIDFASLGRQFWGIRVVDKSGRAASWYQLLLRPMLKMPPFPWLWYNFSKPDSSGDLPEVVLHLVLPLLLLFEYVPPFYLPQHQLIADWLLDTVVVEAP